MTSASQQIHGAVDAQKIWTYTTADVVGREITAVTLSGRIWSAKFWPNGQTEYLNQAGKRTPGTWWKKDYRTLCIQLQGETEVCKVIEQAGSGLGWRNEGARDASSQIFNSEPIAERRALSGRSLLNTNSWQQGVVVGRTLRDKEIWFAYLKGDGTFGFAGSSGKARTGRYVIRNNQVCFIYDGGSGKEHCRFPFQSGSRVEWRRPDGGKLISEIIAAYGVAGRVTTPAYTSAQPSRQCTRRGIEELRAACFLELAGATTCSFALDAEIDAGALGSAFSGAACTAAAAKLRSCEVAKWRYHSRNAWASRLGWFRWRRCDRKL